MGDTSDLSMKKYLGLKCVEQIRRNVAQTFFHVRIYILRWLCLCVSISLYQV